MSAVIAPLLRSWISVANRRQSRSRKSPSVAVPPGNWCEIFSAVPARALPNRRSAGAAIPKARACRLEMLIPYLPLLYCIFYSYFCIQYGGNCMLYVLSSMWYGNFYRVYAMSQAFSLKQAIEDAVIAGEFVPGDR